jgi:hypothetical protein
MPFASESPRFATKGVDYERLVRNSSRASADADCARVALFRAHCYRARLRVRQSIASDRRASKDATDRNQAELRCRDTLCALCVLLFQRVQCHQQKFAKVAKRRCHAHSRCEKMFAQSMQRCITRLRRMICAESLSPPRSPTALTLARTVLERPLLQGPRWR